MGVSGEARARGAVSGRPQPDDVPVRLGREPDRHGRVACLSVSGFHEVAYTDWGPADAEDVVVCLHGLTRQGRDFDVLAMALAREGYRVVCPDLPGRGRSDWLPNAFEYTFPLFCADMVTVVASLNAKRLYWVGTSLGGLIGILLASRPQSPIRALVVNDIGPAAPAGATTRVAVRLLTEPTSFASMEEAVLKTRKIYAACGTLDEEQWRHMAVHSVRQDEKTGRYVSLTDPKVGTAYRWFWTYGTSIWTSWEALGMPVLALHGTRSDFVPPDLLRRMKARLPHLQTFEVADTGHMPMLMRDGEVEAIVSFLQAVR